MLYDRLVNLVTSMGTAKDKSTRAHYVFQPLMPEQAVAAYRTDWIARKVVDVPAQDMVREGRNWQAQPNQIEALEREEARLQVWSKLARAIKLARLYGGSAIILGVAGEDPREPLNLNSVQRGGLSYIHVASRWDITAGQVERDPASPLWGEPTSYTMSSPTGQVVMHPSRVIPFIGAEIPDMRFHDGWGDSVLQVVEDAVKSAGITASGIAHLVQEAKVDVFKIPHFLSNVGDEAYRRKVLERVGLANEAKSISNALLMDAEEGYEQKTINFGQLPEILRLYLQIAAGAADIPATRLLGQSPAGMSATGESDIRNYYDRLASEQETYLRPRLERLDEVLIRSALGSRPEEVHFAFAPLWQMSETDRAAVFKSKAEAARTIAGTGGTSQPLIPIEALSDALANALIEDGSLPGLEAALEAVGDGGDSDEDIGAALPPTQVQTGDAAPRTLYVSRRLENAAEFLSWARSQGFAETVPGEELHVTIAYSRQPVDWMKVGEPWSPGNDGRLIVEPGGARLVEPLGDKGAVVLLFNSASLSFRHEEIRRAGASWDHPEYQPHVTITYSGDGVSLAEVEPYRGRLVFGPERFEEVDDDWARRLKTGAQTGESFA